jgi:hypothetical protein
MQRQSPPRNIDAEISVVGGLLFNGRALDKVSGVVGPEDFYDPRHEVIFDAVTRVAATGHPVDCLTVAAELRRTGGMAKLEIGVREHQIMLQSEAKKNQKYALEEKQLLDSHDPTFHAREGVIFKAQAEAEYVKREIDKANEIAVAKAKDANLVKQGELPRFEAATRASHQKELEDQTSALNFRESSQRSEIYASKIEEAKEKARGERL